MRKRILSLLCAVAIVATMLSVGAVYVFGTSNAMLTAKYVDDSGKTVSNLSAGDTFWAAFSLSDYENLVGGNGDKNVSAVSVNVALDTDKFEVVTNGTDLTWESTPEAAAKGASVTGGINATAKCLAVTFTTDNNGGKSYAMSKDVLAANDGVMFKVKMKVKDSAAEGSTSLTLQNGDSATGTTAVALVTVNGENATTDALAITGMNVTKTINIGTASGTASKASAKDYQNQFTFNGGRADKVFVGADWGVTEKDDAITAIASGSSEEYSEKYINSANELVLGPKSKGVTTTYTATYKDAFDLTNGFIAEYTAKGTWTTNYGEKSLYNAISIGNITVGMLGYLKPAIYIDGNAVAVGDAVFDKTNTNWDTGKSYGKNVYTYFSNTSWGEPNAYQNKFTVVYDANAGTITFTNTHANDASFAASVTYNVDKSALKLSDAYASAFTDFDYNTYITYHSFQLDKFVGTVSSEPPVPPSSEPPAPPSSEPPAPPSSEPPAPSTSTLITGAINASDWDNGEAIRNNAFYAPVNSTGVNTTSTAKSYNLGNKWNATMHVNDTANYWGDRGEYYSLKIGEVEVKVYDRSSSANAHIDLIINGIVSKSYDLGETVASLKNKTLLKGDVKLSFDNGTVTVDYKGENIITVSGQSALDFSNVKATISVQGRWSDKTDAATGSISEFALISGGGNTSSGSSDSSNSSSAPSTIDLTGNKNSISGSINANDWQDNEQATITDGKFYPPVNTGSVITLTSKNKYKLGNSWNAKFTVKDYQSGWCSGEYYSVTVGNVEARIHDYNGKNIANAYIELLVGGKQVASYDLGSEYAKNPIAGDVLVSYYGDRNTIVVNYKGKNLIVYNVANSLDFSEVPVKLSIKGNWVNDAKLLNAITGFALDTNPDNAAKLPMTLKNPISGSINASDWTDEKGAIRNKAFNAPDGDPKNVNKIVSKNSYDFSAGNFWNAGITVKDIPTTNTIGEFYGLKVGSVEVKLYDCNKNTTPPTNAHIDLIIDGKVVSTYDLGSTVGSDFSKSKLAGTINVSYFGKSKYIAVEYKNENVIKYDLTDAIDFSDTYIELTASANWLSSSKGGVNSITEFALNTDWSKRVIIPEVIWMTKNSTISGSINENDWKPNANISNGAYYAPASSTNGDVALSVKNYNLGTYWNSSITIDDVLTTNNRGEYYGIKVGNVQAVIYDFNKDAKTNAHIDLIIDNAVVASYDLGEDVGSTWGKSKLAGTLEIIYDNGEIGVVYKDKNVISYNQVCDFSNVGIKMLISGNFLSNPRNSITAFSLSVDPKTTSHVATIKAIDLTKPISGALVPADWNYSSNIVDGIFYAPKNNTTDVGTINSTYKYNLGEEWTSSISLSSILTTNNIGEYYGLKIGEVEARVCDYDKRSGAHACVQLWVSGSCVGTYDLGANVVNTWGKDTVHGKLSMKFKNGTVVVSYNKLKVIKHNVNGLNFNAVEIQLSNQANYGSTVNQITEFELYTPAVAKGVVLTKAISGKLNPADWSACSDLIDGILYAPSGSTGFTTVTSLKYYDLGTKWNAAMAVRSAWGSTNNYGDYYGLSVGDVEVKFHDSDTRKDPYKGACIDLIICGQVVQTYDMGLGVSNLTGAVNIVYVDGKISVSYKNKEVITYKVSADEDLDFSYTQIQLTVQGDYIKDIAKKNAITEFALGSANSGTFSTGDTRNIVVPVAVAVVGASAIAFVAFRRKRHEAE